MKSTVGDKDTYSLDEKNYIDVLESYDKSTFYPTDILKECPKFRILVIGQTGAGKTTICGKVFCVQAENGTSSTPRDLGVNRYSRGTQMHQVWNEITFPGQNEDIILHDSGGFEAGNETGFEEIQKFIQFRLSAVNLADQLHCIWYCIPLTGHRHIQTSEERFFQEVNVGHIPVIAVFTHFDEIENKYEFSMIKKHQRDHPGEEIPAEFPRAAHALAVTDYDEKFVPALRKIIRGGPHTNVEIRRIAVPEDTTSGDQGIFDLIETTFNMLDKEGSLRRLWTSAQQQSAQLKRNASVEIAVDYVRSVNITNSVPFVPFLGGGMFASSFNEILSQLISQWGLIDPASVLKKASTRRRLFEACLKVSKAGRIGLKIGLGLNILGPLTIALITSALLKTAAGLILIFEDLFWKQREQGGLRLTSEAVEAAAAGFANGKARQTAASFIDGSIQLGNNYKVEWCRDTLIQAIRSAMDEKLRIDREESALKKRIAPVTETSSSRGS